MNDALLAGVAAAVAAVLLLILAGWWWLRGRKRRRIGDPEEAAAAAEALGLSVTGAVVGADGGGALAVTADGRIAAVRRVGSRLIACEVPWRSVRSTRDGIVIETGDRRLGEVMLAGVDALDIRRLAPRGTLG